MIKFNELVGEVRVMITRSPDDVGDMVSINDGSGEVLMTINELIDVMSVIDTYLMENMIEELPDESHQL